MQVAGLTMVSLAGVVWLVYQVRCTACKGRVGFAAWTVLQDAGVCTAHHLLHGRQLTACATAIPHAQPPALLPRQALAQAPAAHLLMTSCVTGSVTQRSPSHLAGE